MACCCGAPAPSVKCQLAALPLSYPGAVLTQAHNTYWVRGDWIASERRSVIDACACRQQVPIRLSPVLSAAAVAGIQVHCCPLDS